jgi:hypothetical protein
MIPKYPFCVSVWRKLGPKLDLRTKSFETLAAANAFATGVLRSPDVKRAQLYCILDDRTRNEAGEIVTFDHEARA